MELDLPADGALKVDLIDTWNMSITPSEKEIGRTGSLELTDIPYMAVRIISQ